MLVTRDRFRVGKTPDNDLVLADETVSRYHFEIVREKSGFMVRDMGSTNGTILDGARIREAYLRSGATLTAGRIRIQVYLPVEQIDEPPVDPHSTFELDSSLTFRESKDRWVLEFERRYVATLLEQSEGNISSAARRAEMDRKYLHKLKKKHGL